MSCVFLYVFFVDVLGFVEILVVVFIIYFSIYLFTYGWYAMNYNFMYYR